MIPASKNPFATDRVSALPYVFLEGSLEELLERLGAMNYRAAIVGPHGHGKTTLLNTLEDTLRARGAHTKRLRLNDTARGIPRQFFAGIDPDTILLLDGAEQLGFWRWRWFLRKSRHARGLIVTTHQPGHMSTLIECRSSRPLLDALLDRIPGALTPDLHREAHALYELHKGDIRQVFFALYDRLAEREGRKTTRLVSNNSCQKSPVARIGQD